MANAIPQVMVTSPDVEDLTKHLLYIYKASQHTDSALTRSPPAFPPCVSDAHSLDLDPLILRRSAHRTSMKPVRGR